MGSVLGLTVLCEVQSGVWLLFLVVLGGDDDDPSRLDVLEDLREPEIVARMTTRLPSSVSILSSVDRVDSSSSYFS